AGRAGRRAGGGRGRPGPRHQRGRQARRGSGQGDAAAAAQGLARSHPGGGRRTLCRTGDRPADPPLTLWRQTIQRHGATRGVFRYRLGSDMLDKTYDPQEIEARLYPEWEQSGAFRAHPQSAKPPYCIVIPPPNVTGSLHMGHALDNTLQDVLIRWRRMKGDDVLWQPGTDHAGIATQMVVVRNLEQEGIGLAVEGATPNDANKKLIDRKEFLARVWEWKAHSGGTIINQ